MRSRFRDLALLNGFLFDFRQFSSYPIIAIFYTVSRWDSYQGAVETDWRVAVRTRLKTATIWLWTLKRSLGTSRLPLDSF